MDDVQSSCRPDLDLSEAQKKLRGLADNKTGWPILFAIALAIGLPLFGSSTQMFWGGGCLGFALGGYWYLSAGLKLGGRVGSAEAEVRLRSYFRDFGRLPGHGFTEATEEEDEVVEEVSPSVVDITNVEQTAAAAADVSVVCSACTRAVVIQRGPPDPSIGSVRWKCLHCDCVHETDFGAAVYWVKLPP